MPPHEKPTLKVTNLPKTTTAQDLLTFLETKLGQDSILAVEISTERKNWKPRDHGRIQFTTLQHKQNALSQPLTFHSKTLCFSENNVYEDVIVRPLDVGPLEDCILHVGFLVREDTLCVVESFDAVKVWVMPERNRVELFLDCWKMEFSFEDFRESIGFVLADVEWLERGFINALLLKVKHAPKIYKKMTGPGVTPRFRADRYRICKEDVDYVWVRTTDFSSVRSIGQSTAFCWQVEGSMASENFVRLPYYREDNNFLILEDGSEEFSSSSEIVPLINVSGSKLAYEVLFQLNSLIHTQKISLAAADSDLFGFLEKLSVDTAITILQKLKQLTSTCYDPIPFLKLQLDALKNSKNIPLSPYKKVADHNLFACYRVLVTPSKVYCLGPELETSNCVVRNFSQCALDFIRVTFVEEDWSKLSPYAISTHTERGPFAEQVRTEIYGRISSILREGIAIGGKKFQFLAFSASQLRSNSVWMFASNDNVKAEDVREWMGFFSEFRTVSKCAARMGQLFSSSKEALVVPEQDVEKIPDIEVMTDGFEYCFSDGIGKISLSFARQVAQKCGLHDTPSAFIIRYGGYKGVVAVDRNSFMKLSLRNSMLKFKSKNTMLNIAKWSTSMPCYLNREIIILLSTLGVKDETLEAMQQEQMSLLAKMLTEKEAALNVIDSLSVSGSADILTKMLRKGYEPNDEPYLSMLLQAYYEILLADLRSRCRIFVPKGRILLGALDETGVLDYGQVYVCVTMTKKELQCGEQSFFRKVGETTSVLIGKVVVTKNPCLHPGDVRVLDAVYVPELEEKGLVDCLVFPQRGERPHPNECSGGDLDGDQFFISWDSNLIPCDTVAPMDYTGRRPRILDHFATVEEIQKFFVEYMISDSLGAISTAHLVHADRKPQKALDENCLELARLHSNAVDFAKSGAPVDMPNYLKPKEFPDFMERRDRPMYISSGVLGKLYRATFLANSREKSSFVWSRQIAEAAYDCELEVEGFEAFLEVAEDYKNIYSGKLHALMNYHGAQTEDEILTGNLRNRPTYLQRDNRKYGDVKDQIMLSVKNLHKEVKGGFENSCEACEYQKMASAWYHVTYHPYYLGKNMSFLSFPWIVGDILLNIKSLNSRKAST